MENRVCNRNGKRSFFLFFFFSFVTFIPLNRLIIGSISSPFTENNQDYKPLQHDVIKSYAVCPVGEPTESITTYQVLQNIFNSNHSRYSSLNGILETIFSCEYVFFEKPKKIRRAKTL